MRSIRVGVPWAFGLALALTFATPEYIERVGKVAYPRYAQADWAAMVDRLFRVREDGMLVLDYDPAIVRTAKPFLLRLLRPTAAAIRRLFVIATCGLAETFRAPRKRNSHPGFIRADIGPGTNNDMLRARDSPLCRRQTPVHIAARNYLT